MAETTAPVALPTTTPPPAATLPPPATPAAAAPADDRVNQLIAKERALVKQQQEIKAERDSIAKERAEAAEVKALLAEAKRNPEAVAKRLWGDDYYDRMTEMRLNGQKVTPDLIAESVDEKLQAFEKRQLAAREQEATETRERLQREQERTITAWREDIKGFVTARGEEYELINLHGWQDQVVKTIEQHFEKTQKIMSTKEAADLVEQQIQEAIQKSLGTKKFKTATPELEKPNGSAQPRTLTNALQTATTQSADLSMTEEDRIARAIAKGREVALRRQA